MSVSIMYTFMGTIKADNRLNYCRSRVICIGTIFRPNLMAYRVIRFCFDLHVW